MTTHLCTVLVVVGMDAELDESWVNNVNQTEDRIVSQWREVSANEKHEMHDEVDKILRRHGLQTRLLVCGACQQPCSVLHLYDVVSSDESA